MRLREADAKPGVSEVGAPAETRAGDELTSVTTYP